MEIKIKYKADMYVLSILEIFEMLKYWELQGKPLNVIIHNGRMYDIELRQLKTSIKYVIEDLGKA